jgi:hypothetical protein
MNTKNPLYGTTRRFFENKIQGKTALHLFTIRLSIREKARTLPSPALFGGIARGLWLKVWMQFAIFYRYEAYSGIAAGNSKLNVPVWT